MLALNSETSFDAISEEPPPHGFNVTPGTASSNPGLIGSIMSGSSMAPYKRHVPSAWAAVTTADGIVIDPIWSPADAAGAGADASGFDTAGAEEEPPLLPPLELAQPAMPAAAAVDATARNFLLELPLFIILSPDDIRLPSRPLN